MLRCKTEQREALPRSILLSIAINIPGWFEAFPAAPKKTPHHEGEGASLIAISFGLPQTP
jgi:hypothetical protein